MDMVTLGKVAGMLAVAAMVLLAYLHARIYADGGRLRCKVKEFLTLPHVHCLHCCPCEDCDRSRGRALMLGIAFREPKR